ncbi:DUF2147 domain-containing protein [Acuticoccus sediminis]|uniref:DUF2147 domain-containing protein n=1 Tax=Acuticoccus sediminis TaxID=2184697 RepID=A0A8B2NCK6_9HYPH|nr:DUF2147 domain-containing protein [Acuticoccus sediminis]RAH96109.1 DUF2147 domain-containing protein [Acuticoccus sediminis]
MFKTLRATLLTAAVVVETGLSLVGPACAQSSGPDAALGIWETANGDIRFEMFADDDRYAGRIIYGALMVEPDGTFKRDVKNPDPALRGRSLEGIVFLTGLTWDPEDQRLEDGSLYLAPRGETASARVTVEGETMELRAYRGTPMLGRTLEFRRVGR